MNRKWLLVSVMTGVALVTGGWLLQRDSSPEGTVYQQARLFDDVLSRVADFYVDSIDERKLYEMPGAQQRTELFMPRHCSPDSAEGGTHRSQVGDAEESDPSPSGPSNAARDNQRLARARIEQRQGAALACER